MNNILKNFFRDSCAGAILFGILLIFSVSVRAENLESYADYFKGSALGKVQTKESEHFRVSWVDPRDEIITDALLHHLELANRDLMPVFQDPVKGKKKAPIEIYPDLKSFSDVSHLSMARFRATGTIALTLEQRLMVLSPRNLAMGYPWGITVVHEYIHYLIREITPDYIPIWLHEGVAQYFQGYPYQKHIQFQPAQLGLFKKIKESKNFLSLETLQEPFPYRKNPEEAELAYIEALIFVRWLDQKCGALNLIRMAGEMKSVDLALAKCTNWTPAELSKKFIPEILEKFSVPDTRLVEFYAKDFSGSDPIESEGRKTDREARNFAQLANELFKQGLYKATATEMEKAFHQTPVAPPSWRRELAMAYEKSGQTQKATEVLQQLLKDYPDDAGAWYLLGAERLKAQKEKEAWRDFMKAFFVNPFLDGLKDIIGSMHEKNPKFDYTYSLLPRDKEK